MARGSARAPMPRSEAEKTKKAFIVCDTFFFPPPLHSAAAAGHQRIFCFYPSRMWRSWIARRFAKPEAEGSSPSILTSDDASSVKGERPFAFCDWSAASGFNGSTPLIQTGNLALSPLRRFRASRRLCEAQERLTSRRRGRNGVT